MGYPKINSLWKRADDHSLIIGDYACDEFKSISMWRVEEKIDGTNIMIKSSDGSAQFGGRTKDSIMPPHLKEYLENHFRSDLLRSMFPENKYVLLYGEGYGHKIQAGDYYRKDVGFMLFDVVIDRWWLTREGVHNIGQQLNIPVAPDLGIMHEQEIIDFVKSKPESRCSIKPHGMEGVIVRSEPLMLFRNGKPIVWKLKVRDFN